MTPLHDAARALVDKWYREDHAVDYWSTPDVAREDLATRILAFAEQAVDKVVKQRDLLVLEINQRRATLGDLVVEMQKNNKERDALHAKVEQLKRRCGG